MAATYLERYLRGGEEQIVWNELIALGGAVRQEPLFADAEAVVRETMRRARFNVEQLVARLEQLNYRFVTPDGPWFRPTSTVQQQLDSFEERYGVLPLSLRIWYETVGVVDFAGYHPKLSFYAEIEDEDEAGEDAPTSDPLTVLGMCEDMPEDVFVWHERGGNDSKEYGLYISLDMCHKANCSGGGVTHIWIPNTSIDAPLVADFWNGMYFVDYLRLSFQHGGFAYLSDPDMVGYREAAQEEMAFLTKDLLAI